MTMDQLIAEFSTTTENQCKAIFNTLFIVGNRLQTLFDSRIPELSLKQFMLLSVARQSKEPMALTQLGELLGCSRQNVKKLAEALEKKGFVAIRQSPSDARALCLCPTQRGEDYFQGDFAAYAKELRSLFEVYTAQEIKTLFVLLSRMYAGIDRLEQKPTP